MTYETSRKGIEQYTVEEAIASLVNAPSQSAAEAIFRLLDPAVKAQIRRAAHVVAGERMEGGQ